MLDVRDVSGFNETNFDFTKKTKMFLHGYCHNGDAEWYKVSCTFKWTVSHCNKLISEKKEREKL